MFEANTTYTFTIHSAFPGGGGRIFLYIYDGTVVTDGGDDADNLNFIEINPQGGDVASDGTGTWEANSVSYTTGAAGAEIGNAIGISFWSSGNVYFDDASVDATPIPEPGSLALLAMGGLAMLRRRRNG